MMPNQSPEPTPVGAGRSAVAAVADGEPMNQFP
jgi:hypothetical protein